MADPVSNTEIEDVLSSIRQLVSERLDASKGAACSKLESSEPVAKLYLSADFLVPQPSISPFSKRVSDNEAMLETATRQAGFSDSDGKTDSTPTTLEHTIAELEAAIAKQEGEWEPDGSGFVEDVDAEELMVDTVQERADGSVDQNDDTSGFFASLDKKVGAEAVAKAKADKSPGKKAELLGKDASGIDEDALQDLISAIVRQELQGALGAQITRKVRKLVRREINLVLAAQDIK